MVHKRARQSATWFALVGVLVSLTACASSSNFMANQAHVLQPCGWKLAVDPQTSSFAALMQAMQDNRWTIVGGVGDQGFLRTQACRHTTCVTVDSYVAANGTVEIYRTPGQELSRNGAQLVEGWMQKLDKRWERYRCDPPTELIDTIDNLYLPAGSVPPKPS